MDRQAVEELFAPFGHVQVRAMFGGLGVALNGVTFAIVVDGELFLKTDRDCVEAFRSAGSSPFSYERNGKTIAMSYWRLPDESFDDPDVMKRWCALAFAAACRVATTKAGTGKRTPASATSRRRTKTSDI